MATAKHYLIERESEFIVDTKAPDITINAPIGAPDIDSETVSFTVNGTVDVKDVGLAGLKPPISGGVSGAAGRVSPTSDSTANYTATVKVVENATSGSFTVAANASDNLGNTHKDPIAKTFPFDYPPYGAVKNNDKHPDKTVPIVIGAGTDGTGANPMPTPGPTASPAPTPGPTGSPTAPAPTSTPSYDDTQAPDISSISIEKISSDPNDFRFRVSGIVRDKGTSGLDLEKLQVRIDGATVVETDNPFFPKSESFSKEFLIQPTLGAVITVTVTAVDKAGNEASESSDSAEMQKLRELRDRFESSLLQTTANMVAYSSCSLSAYRTYSLAEDYVTLVRMRDAAMYAAANDALYGPDQQTRKAAFLVYATLANIPLTYSEAGQLAVSYAAGVVVVKGGAVVFKALEPNLKILQAKLCDIVEDNSSIGFRHLDDTASSGTLTYEKGYFAKETKPLEEHEKEAVAYLLRQGDNVQLRFRRQGEKVSDIRINGERAEIKSLLKINLAGKDPTNQIANKIKDAYEQSSYVIVDARAIPAITEDMMREAAARVWGKNASINKIRVFGREYGMSPTRFNEYEFTTTRP